jgi:predicted nucleotidyltransferase
MLQKLIVKIAKQLDKNSIPYMLIGGQAVLLYGIVRLTEDIDITLGVDIDKLSQVKNLLKESGLTIPKNVNDDFVKKTNVLVGIDKDTGIRVDFIFSFTPYEKQALKKRVKKVRLNHYKVNFASCEDTIIHKMFAARPRDLEDVKILLQKNIKRLDTAYIKKWLKEFSDIAGYSLVRALEKILNSK